MSDGRRLERARLPEGVEGVARFHALVAGYAEEPGDVVIATETDRGLFVGSLVARRLPGLRRQPDVGGALPGTPRNFGGEVGPGGRGNAS